jgi:hypothetical protein
MSEKNVEQQTHIKFCVKINKSTSETFALLTLACGEYAMKKLSVFQLHKRFKEGQEMWKISQEVGSEKYKGQM